MAPTHRAPPGSSKLGAFSGAPVPMRVADILGKQPHVVAVAPVVLQVTSTTNIEIIYGIDLKSFEALGGPSVISKAALLSGPDDMIVDDLFAVSNKVNVGSKINVLNHDFQSAALFRTGAAPAGSFR